MTPASAELEAHLYCQIDDSPASPIGGGGDEDEYGEMRELRVFIQDNKCTLETASSLEDKRGRENERETKQQPNGADKQYHPSLKLYQIVQHYTILYSLLAKRHLSHSSLQEKKTMRNGMKKKRTKIRR